MTAFVDKLSTAAQAVEAHLQDVLPQSGPMADAMQYAVLNGGKRLRAFLVMESARLHGANPKAALQAAAAIECIHAYSLVHDDMPCMDDDDLRRGKPTVHVKWDEATAVLVGDGLQSFAFELLADNCVGSPSVRLTLVQTLAKGAHAMVVGQAQDIAAETTSLNLDEIVELQANKTGALIRWSACAGAYLAAADTAALDTYADAIGLAFQIQDDILDVEGDSTATGKRTQKDATAGKETFVSLLGLEGAKERAMSLSEQAKAALASYGTESETLCQLADYIVTRDK